MELMAELKPYLGGNRLFSPRFRFSLLSYAFHMHLRANETFYLGGGRFGGRWRKEFLCIMRVGGCGVAMCVINFFYISN